MAAILSQEIMIFSDRKKSVFQLWWKNTSSHKKIYKTKKLYLIGLHMEWFKISHLRPKPAMLQLKIWFFEKCQNFQNLSNFGFFFVTKIVAKGWKMTNKGYFSSHMGPNTYVQGYMLLKGLLDNVHGPQRSIYWSGHFMPPPAPCMNLNRPPLVGLKDLDVFCTFKIKKDTQNWEKRSSKDQWPYPDEKH